MARVMQHEMVGYVERILRGVEVTDENLGIDVIRRAKQQGSFLAEEHTVEHFRRELWFPQLLDRQFFDTWAADGKEDMISRCIARKDQILQAHTPEPIDEDRCRAIDKLLNDAKKHLAE